MTTYPTEFKATVQEAGAFRVWSVISPLHEFGFVKGELLRPLNPDSDDVIVSTRGETCAAKHDRRKVQRKAIVHIQLRHLPEMLINANPNWAGDRNYELFEQAIRYHYHDLFKERAEILDGYMITSGAKTLSKFEAEADERLAPVVQSKIEELVGEIEKQVRMRFDQWGSNYDRAMIGHMKVNHYQFDHLQEDEDFLLLQAQEKAAQEAYSKARSRRIKYQGADILQNLTKDQEIHPDTLQAMKNDGGHESRFD